MTNVKWEVTPELKDRLSRVNGPAFRIWMKNAVKKGADPALQIAKSRSPVRTGKLRASLGMTQFTSRSRGEVGVKIEPKSNFSFNNELLDLVQGPGLSARESTANQRTLVTRKGIKGKSLRKAWGAGARVDTSSPWFYIRKIELGYDQRGRVSRKAGGARMLTSAIASRHQDFFKIVGDEAMRFITK